MTSVSVWPLKYLEMLLLYLDVHYETSAWIEIWSFIILIMLSVKRQGYMCLMYTQILVWASPLFNVNKKFQSLSEASVDTVLVVVLSFSVCAYMCITFLVFTTCYTSFHIGYYRRSLILLISNKAFQTLKRQNCISVTNAAF